MCWSQKIMCPVENGRWLELPKFTLDMIVLCERQQCKQKRVFLTDLCSIYRLEIASATPQVIPEDAPVHGMEKLETNCVNTKNVPVTKPKRNVAFSKRGQGGENVTARYTCSGRLRVMKSRAIVTLLSEEEHTCVLAISAITRPLCRSNMQKILTSGSHSYSSTTSLRANLESLKKKTIMATVHLPTWHMYKPKRWCPWCG